MTQRWSCRNGDRLELEVIDRADGAALVAAGLLSVVVLPALAVGHLR